MSFSENIKHLKKPVFVLISGSSGVGKTTLISYLLDSHPQTFQQPLSYTSRPRRDQEERYEFVDEATIQSLFSKGELLNLDFVYGTYYGVSKKSLTEITNSNRVPIKEIHPDNYHKFESDIFRSVTVLLYSSDLLTDQDDQQYPPSRRSRPKEMFEVQSERFDILLNICGLSSEQAGEHLIKLIQCCISEETGHSALVDFRNMNGYNKIAPDFVDSKRVTTKNFHDASLVFWTDLLSNLHPKRPIIEIGPGNGWLFSTITYKGSPIYGIEISGKMKADYLKSCFVCSARSMPVKSSSVPLIVSSLADPFISKWLFLEVSRVLEMGGAFAFTTPSNIWAENLPGRIRGETTFKLSTGEDVGVISVCPTKDELNTLLEDTGLVIASEFHLKLPVGYKEPISIAITRVASAINVDISELAIVTGYVIKKVPR
ncbi:MAG: hypothetical protein Q7U82_10990 [Gammaproteobacteria bacterium]|nr:hypothetical protein [Gammaproteobacteria bacterium]